MLVIGIKGLIGAGKSTVAQHLIDHHGFVGARFAGGIKEMLRALLRYRGCSKQMAARLVDGDLKDEPTTWLNGVSARVFMEGVGGHVRLGIHRNCGIDTETDHLHGTTPERVVIEDVRHPNEAQAVRDMGGKIWEVYRPGLDPKDHDTERSQLAIRADVVIVNDIGKLDATERQLDRLVGAMERGS
jgi:hypothetical protein